MKKKLRLSPGVVLYLVNAVSGSFTSAAVGLAIEKRELKLDYRCSRAEML
jgi:hypothetical protein